MSWSLVAQEQNNSTTGHQSSMSLNIPAGISANQLIVAVLYYSATDSAWTAPTGNGTWTQRETGSDVRQTVWDKLVTSADVSNAGTGTWTFTNSASDGYIGYELTVWSGNDTTAPYDNSTTIANATATFTEGTAGDLVLSYILSNNTSSVISAPTGFTENAGASYSGSHGGAIVDAAYDTSYSGSSIAWTNSKGTLSQTVVAYKLASGGTTYNESITVGGTAAMTAAGLSTAAVSVTADGTAGMASGGSGDLSASATISSTAGISASVTAIMDALAGIGGSADITASAAATLAASLAISGSADLVIATSGGGTTYNESITVAGSSGISLAAATQMADQITLGATSGLSAAETAKMAVQIAMAGSAAFSTIGTVTMADAVSVATSAGLVVSPQSIVAATLAIAGSAGLTTSAAGNITLSLCRFYYVALESRSYAVGADSRTYTVENQNRTFAVDAEARTYSVGNDDRTFTVPC